MQACPSSAPKDGASRLQTTYVDAPVDGVREPGAGQRRPYYSFFLLMSQSMSE
jgi:hypothetical protein